MTQELRVSAYAICVEDGKVLLARWVGPEGPKWTLPGGGIDHGEDPADAAIREVREETGFTIEIERLLGVDSLHANYPREDGAVADFHGLRIVYAGRIVGGALQYERDGSTDIAAWFPLEDVVILDRVSLVDAGLGLHAEAAHKTPRGAQEVERHST